MTGKVERVHLRRAAYVYVRQSTMAQVERNTESLERQYELVDRAVALGWAAADVVVVDRDLGVSAKSTAGREGFERVSPVEREALPEALLLGSLMAIDIQLTYFRNLVEVSRLGQELALMVRDLEALRKAVAAKPASVAYVRGW